jgi:hypothetical protein
MSSEFSIYEEKLEHQDSFPGSLQSGAPAECADCRALHCIKRPVAQPLAGYSFGELEAMGESYARQYIRSSDENDIRAFRQGAVCAQYPAYHGRYAGLSRQDQQLFQREFNDGWRQPLSVYIALAMCSACAVIPGMGESFSSPSLP